jgi:hypothetical protein
MRQQVSEEDCMLRRFLISAPHQILFGCSNQVRDGPGCGMYDRRGACKVLVGKPETTWKT